MTHPLDGVQAKIDHAREHLDSLRDKLLAFTQPDSPYEVVFREVDRDQRIYSGHLHVLKEPPLEFGVLVGDVAHDLRSALDHLVYQVALLSTTTPEGTQFPVCSTKEAYWEAQPRARRSTRDSHLQGIPEEHRTFFDREQPYLAGDQRIVELHPLTRLVRLSNRDKHRIVAEAFARPISLVLRPLKGEAQIQVTIDRQDTAMIEGTRIFTARVIEKNSSQVDIKVDMQTFPAFGNPPLGWDDLDAITSHVVGIAERFRVIFE